MSGWQGIRQQTDSILTHLAWVDKYRGLRFFLLDKPFSPAVSFKVILQTNYQFKNHIQRRNYQRWR